MLSFMGRKKKEIEKQATKALHPDAVDKIVKALLAYRKFVFTTRDVMEKHKKLVDELKAKAASRS